MSTPKDPIEFQKREKPQIRPDIISIGGVLIVAKFNKINRSKLNILCIGLEPQLHVVDHYILVHPHIIGHEASRIRYVKSPFIGLFAKYWKNIIVFDLFEAVRIRLVFFPLWWYWHIVHELD
jgi:hypothetical protein